MVAHSTGEFDGNEVADSILVTDERDQFAFI